MQTEDIDQVHFQIIRLVKAFHVNFWRQLDSIQF